MNEFIKGVDVGWEILNEILRKTMVFTQDDLVNMYLILLRGEVIMISSTVSKIYKIFLMITNDVEIYHLLPLTVFQI